MSVSLEESRNPLAKGLLSIFSLVIWKGKMSTQNSVMSVVKETKSEIKSLFIFHHSTPRMSKNILISLSIVTKVETAKEIHKFG